MKIINYIRNARYLEDGSVKCEVLLEGRDTFIPYAASASDTAETGQQIWQELQSGKWGEITPFTVTEKMLEAARKGKRMEIEAWREEQEAQTWTLEWNGHTWNAGTASLSRLYLVVMAAKSGKSRNTLSWGNADNEQVLLSAQDVEELAATMAQAQVDRNDEIYRRQREMKEALNTLKDLSSIRKLAINQ
ncbi:TPA: DUF4376 domain-containing protein [Escherichia coli]|nr:DUF4376 domain-containing protein [Escherichia coli]